MKKQISIFLSGLLLLILCSCGEEDILGEIPRDYAIATAETPGESGQEENSQAAAPSSEAEESNEGSGSEEEESPFSFLMEEASVYAYNNLSEMERIWYRDMEEILGSFGTERKLSGACLESGMGEGS